LDDAELLYRFRQQARQEMEEHRRNASMKESRLTELKLYYGISDEHYDELLTLVRDLDRERRLMMVAQVQTMGRLTKNARI